jgi:hypothetical protein
MSVSAHIALDNPSSHERHGVVVMPWKELRNAGHDEHDVQVFQDNEALLTQVDCLDPNDRDRDELAFVLRHAIGARHPSTNWAATVTTGPVKTRNTPEPIDPCVDALPDGVKLRTRDENFKVWINTSADHDGYGSWFAGAVTSIETGPIDLLDTAAHFKSWDPRINKRIQVDRFRLFCSALDETQPWIDEYVFNKPWTTVATSEGPVRALATIRSAIFKVEMKEIGKPKQEIYCAMYRTFSIYRGDCRLHESMCVRRMLPDEKPGDYLWFAPRYFMVMRLALAEPIRHFRYPSHSGWFSLASSLYPYSAYGFSTNAHAGPIWNPPLDYKDDDEQSQDDAFMWDLSSTRMARAIHTLAHHTNERVHANRAGAAWYDDVYHPLSGAKI